MSGIGRRHGRALFLSRELTLELGRQILVARQPTGLSQDAAGGAVGMSGSQFGRIERAENKRLTIDQVTRASAAVGLRPRLALVPDGDPVRDAGHIRLLERLRGRLPSSTVWRTEVPLPGSGDLRSWDAVLRLVDGTAAVEAETRLRDVQATWRRIAMKLRDGLGIDIVVLLIADTPANRRAVAFARELLRPELPLDTRAVMNALERGLRPAASGLAFL